jgi:hypothetical protein
MAAPISGQTVHYYPKRGGQLATLNAIQAITPLNARVVTVGPTLKLTLYVNDASLKVPFTIKNIPYFDSEYAARPYTTIIPGDGGYCVSTTDAPAFPPPQTVPATPAGWNMPLSPIVVPSNPEDSAQPYVPVKIMEDNTAAPAGTVVVSDPQ